MEVSFLFLLFFSGLARHRTSEAFEVCQKDNNKIVKCLEEYIDSEPDGDLKYCQKTITSLSYEVKNTEPSGKWGDNYDENGILINRGPDSFLRILNQTLSTIVRKDDTV